MMTREEQSQILEEKLRQVGQQIYSAEIDVQVAKKVEDERMKTASTEAMARLMKIKDAYQGILNKLMKGDE
jgi:hypothetical protein